MSTTLALAPHAHDVRALALVKYREMQERIADFRAEKAYYRDHTRYTHPACIHGTSRWTEYDNICAGCEDGRFTEYTDATDLRRLALDDAYADLARDMRDAARGHEDGFEHGSHVAYRDLPVALHADLFEKTCGWAAHRGDAYVSGMRAGYLSALARVGIILPA